MDKKLLEDYIDACKLIEETERELKELEEKKVPAIMGKVKGSNEDFPFQKRSYTIHGKYFSGMDSKKVSVQRKILNQRKEKAEHIKRQIEEWMPHLSMRMQRIIKYRILDGFTWEEVAIRIGRGATGDSIRMEYKRFFEKK